jgi:hypothetical protein
MSAAISGGLKHQALTVLRCRGRFLLQCPQMRIHPISWALARLKGQLSIHDQTTFDNPEEAIACLKKFTGKDFGTYAKKWGEWLRKNRWVYHSLPGQLRKRKKV